MNSQPCACLERGPAPGTFDEAYLGVDRGEGRHADVFLRTCRACGRRWVHCHMEDEAFTASGRWYAGVLPEGAEAPSAEDALAVLGALPWHVYGGSWFGHAGRRNEGPLPASPGVPPKPIAPAEPAPDEARRALADVLRETRALLARPDNDFSWSSWRDTNSALADMDDILDRVASGAAIPSVLITVFFAPTGPIQETAVSSGWGDEFLDVAARCDAALARVEAAS